MDELEAKETERGWFKIIFERVQKFIFLPEVQNQTVKMQISG